jgi:hypothetical protein
MDTPLTHRRDNNDTVPRSARPGAADAAPGADDAVDPAGDADRMLRVIVGSTYLDPQEIRRKLDDLAPSDPAAPGPDLHFGLVLLAVALVFLIFAFDLIFSKW